MRRITLLSGILAATVLATGLPAQNIQLAILDVPRTLHVQTQTPVLIDVNPALLRRVGGAENLRVRLVQGRPEEILQLPAERDGCVILVTTVAHPRELRGGTTLNLGIVFTNNSLRVRHGRPDDQAWYVIFERMNDAGPVIRVNKRDLADVLKHGIQVTVLAPRSVSPEELRSFRDGRSTRRAGSSGATATAGQTQEMVVPCRVLLAASPDEMQLAVVDRCGTHRDRRTAPPPASPAGDTIAPPPAAAVWDLMGETLGG